MTSAWQPRGAWAGATHVGRHGSSHGEAGVRLLLREEIGLATIIVAGGREAALREILHDRLGWWLPEVGTTSIQGERGLVWSAPGQWLGVAETRRDLSSLQELLQGVAAVTDQSDGRAVVRVSGHRARAMLAKGVALDLHPRAFRTEHTAVTNIAHINAQIWQRDEGPTYDIMVARSFAGSFWSWLTHAAAEFGYEVERSSAR
jgi:methylglutamate dehydrogenase subunit D|nr:sarcosine oxidase subunit gamma family protein [Methylorubrum extorquens]